MECHGWVLITALHFMDPSDSFLCQVNCTIGSTSGGLWMSPDGHLEISGLFAWKISSHHSGPSYK